jgi:hypothetical protein
VYVSQKTEIVANLEVQYSNAGPYPVITGNCFTGNLNVGAYVGGEIRLAGLKLPKQQPIYTKVIQVAKQGSACH